MENTANTPLTLGLLGIKIFNISNQFICDVQKEAHNNTWIEGVLPECVVVDGEIHVTSEFFDNVELFEELKHNPKKTWLMFDTEYIHPILSDIAEGEFEAVEIYNEMEMGEFLIKTPSNSESDYQSFKGGDPIFLCISVEAHRYDDYYSGGYEIEVTHTIFGHLDNNFNLVKNGF